MYVVPGKSLSYKGANIILGAPFSWPNYLWDTTPFCCWARIKCPHVNLVNTYIQNTKMHISKMMPLWVMILIIFINLEVYLKWAFLLYKANGKEKQRKASLVIKIELAQIFKTRLSYFSISLPCFFSALRPCGTSCQESPLVLSEH